MASSRNHQEAHGLGQIEKQLDRQADAAASLQGLNDTDRSIQNEARRQQSELDDLMES